MNGIYLFIDKFGTQNRNLKLEPRKCNIFNYLQCIILKINLKPFIKNFSLRVAIQEHHSKTFTEYVLKRICAEYVQFV